MKDLFFNLSTYSLPLRHLVGREIVRRLFSYWQRLDARVVERTRYGRFTFQGARLASLVDNPRISVIEFGCGGGKRLINAEKHIAEVVKTFPVQIERSGVDLGSGLPVRQDYRVIPHLFQTCSYKMDLAEGLLLAKPVIGDIIDRCKGFSRNTTRRRLGRTP